MELNFFQQETLKVSGLCKGFGDVGAIKVSEPTLFKRQSTPSLDG